MISWLYRPDVVDQGLPQSSRRTNILDNLFKVTLRQLVENGEILWGEMKKSAIAREDLIEQMRTEGHTDHLNAISKAYFERSGDISVIKFDPQHGLLEGSRRLC